MLARPRGFTLIEILMVVVIIGVLAALAVPKFSRSRSMTYSATIRQDLRTLSVAQEDYFLEKSAYASDSKRLNFLTSPGVTITIVEANAYGWSATGNHPLAYPIVCAVYWGPVSPHRQRPLRKNRRAPTPQQPADKANMRAGQEPEDIALRSKEDAWLSYGWGCSNGIIILTGP